MAGANLKKEHLQECFQKSKTQPEQSVAEYNPYQPSYIENNKVNNQQMMQGISEEQMKNHQITTAKSELKVKMLLSKEKE